MMVWKQLKKSIGGGVKLKVWLHFTLKAKDWRRIWIELPRNIT
jgi:hypothetical protein